MKNNIMVDHLRKEKKVEGGRGGGGDGTLNLKTLSMQIDLPNFAPHAYQFLLLYPLLTSLNLLSCIKCSINTP
jgi:hypothetical protein